VEVREKADGKGGLRKSKRKITLGLTKSLRRGEEQGGGLGRQKKRRLRKNEDRKVPFVHKRVGLRNLGKKDFEGDTEERRGSKEGPVEISSGGKLETVNPFCLAGTEVFADGIR